MNTKLFSPKFLTISSMILLAAIMRLIPHWPNFTPIAAMAIFGGTYFSKKHQAFIIPLLALFISDLIIGLHSFMLVVYFSFILTVVLSFTMRNKVKIANIALISFLSATMFYLITNFAVWMGSPYYVQSFEGLIVCYAAGLPFFGFQLLGDLFFTGLLFGSYHLISQRIPKIIQY